MIAELDATSSAACGLQLRRSDDGSSYLEIGWDVARKEAWVSVIKNGEVVTYKAPWKARMAVKPEGKQDPAKIKFQVIIDRGLVEVFVDDEKTINRWAEELPLDCTGVAVFAEGGEASVSQLEYWELTK